MTAYDKLLGGGDYRSLGNTNAVVSKIRDQDDFDELFGYLFHKDKLVAMRCSDAIEKITVNNPHFLIKHKKALLDLSDRPLTKELKWHLALLIPRLPLNPEEFGKCWEKLIHWAKDKTNSRIARVHSIQGLFEMLRTEPELIMDFNFTLTELEKEEIPSINARIRNLRKQIS